MFTRSRKSLAKALVEDVCRGDKRRVLGLLTDDIQFVDSMSERVSGKEAFAELLDGFQNMDLDLEIKHDLIAVQGDEVLMSGEQTSSDPRFNARTQWRVRFSGRKIAEIQTYRGAGAPSVVRMVNASRGVSDSELNTPQQSLGSG